MYEPLFVPKIENKLMSLDGIKFGISYSNTYRTPNDPLSDPLHIHDYTEIFFHLSGDASFLINDRLYQISEGNAVISRPNEIHRCIFNQSCRFEHFCLWIAKNESFPLFSSFESSDSSPVLSFDSQTGERLTRLFHTLKEQCDTDGFEMERTISFLQILALLQKKSIQAGGELSIPAELQQILSYINENFTDIYSVKELLKSHFISSATMNRWFRKYLQVSPHEYIESKKLSYAVKLLAGGSTVTDASARSGFSDCSHFIALFKKKFGETPLQYKKSIK